MCFFCPHTDASFIVDTQSCRHKLSQLRRLSVGSLPGLWLPVFGDDLSGLRFLAFGSGLAYLLSCGARKSWWGFQAFAYFWDLHGHNIIMRICFLVCMWLICAYEWRKTRAMIRTTLCCLFGIWWTFHFSLPLLPLLRCPSFPSQQPSRSLLAPLSKRSSYSASLFIDAHTHTRTQIS